MADKIESIKLFKVIAKNKLNSNIIKLFSNFTKYNKLIY